MEVPGKTYKYILPNVLLTIWCYVQYVLLNSNTDGGLAAAQDIIYVLLGKFSRGQCRSTECRLLGELQGR